MNETNLFCCHGWVTKDSPPPEAEDDTRVIRVSVVEPPNQAVHRDSLWQEEVIRISPYAVIATISSLSAWLDRKPGGTVLAHARFFPTAARASVFASEYPLDQRNFTLLLGEGISTVIRPPDPFPMSADQDESPYLVLDAYLDRWAPTPLRWFRNPEEIHEEFRGLAGMTGGCMLRCAFPIKEDAPVTQAVAAWLHATGPSDRMRWPIHPWPEHLPPPHVE